MKKPNSIRKDLIKLYYDFEILAQKPCTPEENHNYASMIRAKQQLPEGVYYSATENIFYTLRSPGLSEAEIDRYIALKKLSYLRIIKNCAIFFTALVGISLLAATLLLAL